MTNRSLHQHPLIAQIHTAATAQRDANAALATWYADFFMDDVYNRADELIDAYEQETTFERQWAGITAILMQLVAPSCALIPFMVLVALLAVLS